MIADSHAPYQRVNSAGRSPACSAKVQLQARIVHYETVSVRKCALHRSIRTARWMSSSRTPSHPPREADHTHIQNNGDASPRFRGEELLLSHGHLLLAGSPLPAGDVLVVAHFGDDPADEPVDSTGLGAAVSGLRCRRGLAVLTGYGFRLLAAFLRSKFHLFFVKQFVDSVPTVARCLLTHPFAAERSCCALWEREREDPTPPPPLHHSIHPKTHPPILHTLHTPGTVDTRKNAHFILVGTDICQVWRVYRDFVALSIYCISTL